MSDPSFKDALQAKVSESAVKRDENGEISLLHSLGGYRGLAESIVPGTVFFVLFFITRDLKIALISSLSVAAIFTAARLIQKTPFTQAIFGIASVGICAAYASYTNNASDFYVPGFFTNAGYLAAALFSIAVGWPLAGIVLGFIFGEDTRWRQDPARKKVYVKCTLIYAAIFVVRLSIQLPLYFAGPEYVDYLGFTRLAMGVPIYVIAVWFIWNMAKSSPPLNPELTQEKPSNKA